MSAKVMVVDDEPEVVRLLEVILNRAGFAVLKAGSGPECLMLLRQQDPDVIILDNMMPGMTGVEVLKSLHSMYKDITQPPVIFLSAKGGMDAMVEGLQAGAYKYLVKPTSREKLMEVVRAALDYGENKRHPVIQPPDWM